MKKFIWLLVIALGGGLIIGIILPYPWYIFISILWGGYVTYKWNDIWDHYNID